MRKFTMTKVEFMDGSMALINLSREVIEDNIIDIDGVECYELPWKNLLGVEPNGDDEIGEMECGGRDYGKFIMEVQRINRMEEVEV